MKLSTLLNSIGVLLSGMDIDINDLSLDSRHVKKGDLFFACQGTHLDGRQFIESAIQKGAAAVLLEADHQEVVWQNAVPSISIPQLKTKIGHVAAYFYGFPAKKMQMVGVTGTSGKTSCTHFIAAALHQLNISCGVIGTLGNGLYGKLQASNLTTPDAITLQKTFADLLQQGAKAIAMEVSSHSLDQGRVNGVEFDVGIFTNLTRDHLDYHVTMEAYGAAKKRLFDHTKSAVINLDDPFGLEIMESLDSRHVIAYGRNIAGHRFASVPTVLAKHAEFTTSGIRADLVTPWGSGELQVPLIGQFNLSNLLAALSALCLLDIPLDTVLQCLSQLQSVPGRMEMLGGEDKPLVVVDYAHKPDALEKVLIALREHCHGKLYCVFGCGGERDRGKRPIMAKIAEHYSDHVIVTDDNPRCEDPAQIVEDILQGLNEG